MTLADDYTHLINELTGELNDEVLEGDYYPIIEWDYGADLDDEDMAEYIEDENNQIKVTKATVEAVLNELTKIVGA